MIIKFMPFVKGEDYVDEFKGLNIEPVENKFIKFSSERFDGQGTKRFPKGVIELNPLDMLFNKLKGAFHFTNSGNVKYL